MKFYSKGIKLKSTNGAWSKIYIIKFNIENYDFFNDT